MKKRRIIYGVAFFVILSLLALQKNHIEAASEAKYEIRNEKVTYKDGDTVRGIVYFQYPQLEGNSAEIKRINKVLENAMKAYMKDEKAERLKEYTSIAIDNQGFFNEKEQYYWKTNCKITYNENNIISVHMKERWYAGGVYNQKDYGYTFDLKTGKTLTAVDVIGKKHKEVTDKVLSSAKAYLKKNYKDSYDVVWKDVSTIIKSYDAKDFKFYLTPGKARICFESYELNLGTSYQVFSVNSIYN
ncbi:hypothetical protein GCM10023142_19520 [Anaerocolumna aminovalerica]|jgi:hypothetical protein|uniref:Deacetylase PdaC domain-containing protein n=1 Tax=Anaerocolumna aminovalerica TaxID=1527 RepID=A0A1I5FP92_9FIRM|nr:DUF4163 domain-containing protein [Anaerocolumna aminovalerica]SFO25031.1 protein of unknown function [Anaerocolumna aminovalerica]